MIIEKLPTRYFAGRASVQAGSTTVSAHDAAWVGNVWGDDLFFLPSQPMVPPQRVETVNENNTLTLAVGWPGADAVEEAYEVRYVGMIERSTAQTRRVLEQLGDVKAFFDVQVDTTLDRLALESAESPLRANYRVLVSNVGDGTAAIYSKASSAYNDWTSPAPYSGPAVTLEVTDVDDVPFGTPPDVTLSPVAGGYELSFNIPRGMIIQPGTTTTLAPDQPAEVTFIPVTGGYRLDIAIPRGPTGDINGVTPFWTSRLGSDTTQAAALAGLGAQPAGSYAPERTQAQLQNFLGMSNFFGGLLNSAGGEALFNAMGAAQNVGTFGGYFRLPGGIIVQYGQLAPGSGAASGTITFPVAFPTFARSVVGNIIGSNAGNIFSLQLSNASATTFDYRKTFSSGGGVGAAAGEGFWWLAFGN